MRRLQNLDRTSRLLLLGGLGAGLIAWLVTGWMLAIIAVPVTASLLTILNEVFIPKQDAKTMPDDA